MPDEAIISIRKVWGCRDTDNRPENRALEEAIYKCDLRYPVVSDRDIHTILLLASGTDCRAS